ncbi:MAG: thiamine pyrophosphate-dependent enzyme, partial [Clostridia bacterium]|nr:thiamine pyrophosphate-dependent enzyme [Clostridia bacterium]
RMLAGRAKEFDTLRQPGGLAGFPSRSESPFDAFGTGHSSTSLSAALGFAEADRLSGKNGYSVAVVGDGAFTGGMIHEALNNVRKDLRFIVVLNDNDMSISKSTGRVSRYLTRIRVSRSYRMTKQKTAKALDNMPLIGPRLAKAFRRLKSRLKRRVYAHNYFEDLGFLYLGPCDGHNEALLEKRLREAKERQGPVLLHLKTKKGKGVPEAEKDPVSYHALPVPDNEGTFHRDAGETLCRMAEKDPGVVAVTAAMAEGTGLVPFAEAYPQRFFDVGIAEEHAVTFSAGLAAAGMKPYFAVYSTFLQRGFDQVLHDVALQNLPVRFLIDRAGLAKGDGPTHHGIFDVSFLSSVPGVRVWHPASLKSLENMLEESLTADGPLFIRYENRKDNPDILSAFFEGKEEKADGIRVYGDESPACAFIGYGGCAADALEACRGLREQGVNAAAVLLEKIAPYGETAENIASVLPMPLPIVFMEEGIKQGGAGERLFFALRDGCPGFDPGLYRILAIDGHFAKSEKGKNLKETCRVTAEDGKREMLSLLSHGKQTVNKPENQKKDLPNDEESAKIQSDIRRFAE